MAESEVLEYAPSPHDEEVSRSEAESAVRDSARQLCQAWKDLIEDAWEDKMERFGNDAIEALQFFGTDHSFVWDDMAKAMSSGTKKVAASDVMPGFSMTYNVVAELVQIFGPYIYHRNPDRQVKPTKPLEFPRECIVDPMLEYEINALAKKLDAAIMQAAGPLVQQAIQAGVEEIQAQQQAYQAVASAPQFVQQQQTLAQRQGEWQEQVEQYERLVASQSKSVAKKNAKALIMQRLLNYTPGELDLRMHSRRVVDEAIIKGEGVWWTELKEFDDDERVLVGSFYDTVDNFMVDPDVANYEDAQWIGRRRSYPLWKAQELYPDAKFKVSKTMTGRQRTGRTGRSADDGAWAMPNERSEDSTDTNAIVVIWELYSKMGIGGRLKGLPKEVADKVDRFGDFCFVAISESCDYILNLTPKAMFSKDADELFLDVQWPIPFHKDGEYPCTPLVFHWMPNSPYGMSHIKPGIGELKFLDFIMAHLARKVRSASEDIIGVMDAAADDVEKAFTEAGMVDSNGYRIVRIKSHYGKSVSDLFSVMQKPNFNADIWNVVGQVAARLDRRLGLNDRVFGMGGTESRSAADSKNRQAAFSIRPEDMANIVEETAAKLARKEALAIAWYMEPKDVAPIIGEEAAFLYDELIYKQDPVHVVREYDYTIVANSIRRPSRETDQENLMLLAQQALPGMFTYSLQTNQYGPLNWYFKELGKNYPGMDTSGCVFTPAQPPQPPQPTPEELAAMKLKREAAEAELAAAVQRAKNLAAEMQLEELRIVTKAKISSIDVGRKTDLAQIEYQKGIAALEQKILDAALQRKIDAEEHEQEMLQDQEAFEVTKKANEEGGGDARMMRNYRRDYRGYH